MTAPNDTPTTDRTTAPPTPEYRTPARYPVGEATDLMIRSPSGGLRDGTGGWYTFC